MSVTLEDVRRIAKLARLQFNLEEEEALVKDLGSILDYMEQLQDLPNLETEQEKMDGYSSQFREDIPSDPAERSKALAAGSSSHPDYFEVPKVIRKSKT